MEKRPKKHDFSRDKMRDMTIWKFYLFYKIILIIIKVVIKFYIIFSFNPYSENKVYHSHFTEEAIEKGKINIQDYRVNKY